MQEAVELAPNVHSELQMIEMTIRSLQEENSMLKEKMLKKARQLLKITNGQLSIYRPFTDSMSHLHYIRK